MHHEPGIHSDKFNAVPVLQLIGDLIFSGQGIAGFINEKSGRRRSRFRGEADQDSGGKPIIYSGAKLISDSRLKAISNSPTGGTVIGRGGMFSTGG